MSYPLPIYEHPYKLVDGLPLSTDSLYTVDQLQAMGFYRGVSEEYDYLIWYTPELAAINRAHPIYELLKTKKKREEKPMFNRFTYTYEQAKPLLADIERYLAAKTYKLPQCDNPVYDRYNIYIAKSDMTFGKDIQGKQIAGLLHAGWIEEVPWDTGETAVFVHKQANSSGSTMTLSKTHVRLPQLSYLITLTPRDFFSFFQTIAGQRNLLHFELAENEIPERFQTWFSPYYKGQRINSKIADRRWVPRYVIDTIAEMAVEEEEPAQLAQLAAMQYITVMRDDSLIAVPVSTVIALELEWEQIKDNTGNDTDYCITRPDSTSYVLLGR